MNRKKGPIIAIVIICILLIAALVGGAAAYYFYFRPIVQVNKAIEAEDYQTVSDLFDKLKDDEKDDVAKKMLYIAIDLRRDYEKEEATYEDVISIYDLLEEKILTDDEDLAKNRQKIEALKESREHFAAGKKAMEEEAYLDAIAEFEQVIEKDNNFEEAQELIEECRALLPIDITGTWVCKVNFSGMVAKYSGIPLSILPNLLVPVKCDFNTDYTGRLYFDKEDVVNLVDKVIDVGLKLVIEQYCKKLGLSEKQLNSMVKMVYGKDIRTYVRDEMMAQLDAKFSETEVNFNYETEGNVATVKDTAGYISVFVLEGETLKFTETNDPGFEKLKDFGMELPFEFEREEK